jgi:hypothetical protein
VVAEEVVAEVAGVVVAVAAAAEIAAVVKEIFPDQTILHLDPM